MASFKNVLRVLWAAAGITFICFDIGIFKNTSLEPSFWLIMGVLSFVGAVFGLTGGIGAALVAQGILKYKQYTYIILGKIVFDPGFSVFDRVAHGFFIAYGIFLIVLQIKKFTQNKKTDSP